MRNNLFVVFAVWFAAWALITGFVRFIDPTTGGVFYGIMAPLLFGAGCWVLQIVTKYTGKDVECIFTGFGAAAGGAFALYVIPWILS